MQPLAMDFLIYMEKMEYKNRFNKTNGYLGGTPLVLVPQTYGPYNNPILKKMGNEID